MKFLRILVIFTSNLVYANAGKIIGQLAQNLISGAASTGLQAMGLQQPPALFPDINAKSGATQSTQETGLPPELPRDGKNTRW